MTKKRTLTNDYKTYILDLTGKYLEVLCSNQYVPYNKKLFIGTFSSLMYFESLMFVGRTCYLLLTNRFPKKYFKISIKRRPLWDYYSEYTFKMYVTFYPIAFNIHKFKCIREVLNKKDILLYYYYRYPKYITDLFLLRMILEPLKYTIEQGKNLERNMLAINVTLPVSSDSPQKTQDFQQDSENDSDQNLILLKS